MRLAMNFDFENVTVIEFGVGLDDSNGRTFAVIPVDADVQKALSEMAQATWNAWHNCEDRPVKYEPSEKYGSTACVYLPLADEMASLVRELHEAANLPIDSNALDDPSKVFCYFARFTDNKHRRLTALRRATQFKGVLKSRLIRLVSDSLKLVEDRVFKLDIDFDLLADSENVYILRPSGFEFAGKLQQAILDAVPKNIRAIQNDLSFLDLSPIEEYAKKHPRAARYLASIRSQMLAKNINKNLLKQVCEQTGVELTESNGKLIVSEGHEMAFLEVLDRRRYELNLVEGQPERFKAGSRRRIDVKG